jgi:hypothetical protein
MSYVKDLMAAAAQWTKLNPSASGMLKVPRDEFIVEADDLDRLFADFEKTARKKAENDPARSAEILANLEHVRAQHDELATAQRMIREHEDAVENSVNDTEGSGHAKLDMGSGYTVATTPLVLGRWCLAWAYAGYNVFELGNDFVAAMLLTDPREIRFDDLRTPFPGILITIPSGFATGVEGLPYTKLHLSHVDGAWQLYATDGTHVLDTSVGKGQALSWDLLESLETEEPEEITDADADVVRTMRQIAFGMLAYVTAVDRAVEERVVTRPKRVRDDGPRPRVHDVGRSVKIDPILVKYARAGVREIALQLKRRFIVRGHYRNQAHGPGHRDRKLIWIEPFWKGPEEGAKIVHTYRPGVPE